MDDAKLLALIAADLEHLDGLRARLNALDKPARGSRGARSDKRYLGHLHSAFARHALSSAIDHMEGWRLILTAGHLPIGSHLTLLRGALEGAATARYLIDPDVEYTERIRRGALVQLEDWRQRARFEKSIDRPPVTQPGQSGKTGAERVDEHIDRMRRAGMIPEGTKLGSLKPMDITDRVRTYSDEWLWRAASAFAHSDPWSGMLLAFEKTDRPGLSGTVIVKVTGKLDLAAATTRSAMRGVVQALTELEAHHGARS